jgi:hypothetical protein
MYLIYKELGQLVQQLLSIAKAHLALRIPCGLAFLLLCLIPSARADVAVLLEEPYSLDGRVAGTGHTAVYLSRICAASPTVLRRCLPGEEGVVISRYHAVGNNDWFAIPLTAYLFAVEKPQDIPLFADAKIVAALRDRYRRGHLESIAPNVNGGETPPGNWYELAGSAYDRTLYSFQLETSPAQDDAFIAYLNSRSNEAAYKFVTSNCADFVREVVHFYYPRAIGRNWISDLAVSTPKHAAKSFVKYARKHSDLQFSALIIPQVPGTIKRSTPIHGVADTIFKAKKYEIPLLVFTPFVGVGVAVAYYTGGRFNPAHNAELLDPMGGIERPVNSAERKSYLAALDEHLRTNPLLTAGDPALPAWREFVAHAELALDREGRPVMRAHSEDGVLEVGISRGNLANTGIAGDLTRQMLVARLRQELRGGGAPKVSNALARRDLLLLQKISTSTEAQITTVSRTSAESTGIR